MKRETVAENKWMGMYQILDGRPYTYASRRPVGKQHMDGGQTADAVTVIALHGEEIVFIKNNNRPVIGEPQLELPAGMIDEGETVMEAGIRELKEETGLTFNEEDNPLVIPKCFKSAGFTDESTGLLIGSCFGEPSKEFQEDNEDIDVIICGPQDLKRIIEEEGCQMSISVGIFYAIATSRYPS